MFLITIPSSHLQPCLLKLVIRGHEYSRAARGLWVESPSCTSCTVSLDGAGRVCAGGDVADGHGVLSVLQYPLARTVLCKGRRARPVIAHDAHCTSWIMPPQAQPSSKQPTVGIRGPTCSPQSQSESDQSHFCVVAVAAFCSAVDCRHRTSGCIRVIP